MVSKVEKKDQSYWSAEDSKYGLRVLEQDAYSVVVSALRAQGPLTDYKRVLLEHLRTALFISLDRHKSEIRRATNSETLTRICQKLNPLCDTVFEWSEEGKTGGDVIGKSQRFKKSSTHQILSAGEQAALSLADRLANAALQHNKTLPQGEAALFDLINLPKKVYVPEALRDVFGSSDAPRKPLQSPTKLESRKSPQKNPNTNKSARSPGRPRTSIANNPGAFAAATSPGFFPVPNQAPAGNFPGPEGGKKPAKINKDDVNSVASSSTFSTSSTRSETSPVPLGAASSTAQFSTYQHVMQQRENKIKRSPGRPKNSPATNAYNRQKLAAQQSAAKANRAALAAARKAAAAQAAADAAGKPDPTARCARVEPFSFEPMIPGQPKPPRGNPDKRMKRPAASMGGPGRSMGMPVPGGYMGPSGPKKFNPAPGAGRQSLGGPPRFYSEHEVAGAEEMNGNRMMQRRMDPNRRPSDYYTAAYYQQRPPHPSGIPPPGMRYPPPPAGAAYPPGAAYYHSAVLGGVASPAPATPGGPQLASPAAVQAAYSTPTRTYYGNPSAAAMGITVRPTGDGGRAVLAPGPQQGHAAAGGPPGGQQQMQIANGEKMAYYQHAQRAASTTTVPPHSGQQPIVPAKTTAVTEISHTNTTTQLTSTAARGAAVAQDAVTRYRAPPSVAGPNQAPMQNAAVPTTVNGGNTAGSKPEMQQNKATVGGNDVNVQRKSMDRQMGAPSSGGAGNQGGSDRAQSS